MQELELYLKDFVDKHSVEVESPNYLRIYKEMKNGDEINDMLCDIFANIHEKINNVFENLNRRGAGGYFLADDNRYVLWLDKFLQELTFMTKDTSYKYKFDSYYQDIINKTLIFAKPSFGSNIPVDFPYINIINFKPVFNLTHTSFVKTNKSSFQKNLVGAGSYAIVHKYLDKDYDTYFAIKKLKKGYTQKEFLRFKNEYEIMKKCKHPNLLRVYKFFEADVSYTMEYCEESIYDYITKNNTKLSKLTRLNLLNQFLNGVGYLHAIGLLHRDLSYGNILVTIDSYNNPFLKLSDFGLVKDNNKKFTSTDSKVKGTFRDPCLQSFKDYNFKNEEYAMAYIIIYILYGRQNPKTSDCIYPVIEKCLSSDLEKRYSSLAELRNDLNKFLKEY